LRYRTPLLFLTVLIIATSGLVYELLAGTVASYVLGDSVTQFSTTIGAYLFAMGIGAYLSRFVGAEVGQRFVEVELATALVGGLSAPFLFLAFARAESFSILLYGTILTIGTLVGLEIPLMMRILREKLDFADLVAKVLTFDYVGALFGSVLFALVLVPKLGLNQTSILFGLLNCGVALLSTWLLADLITARVRLRLRVIGLLLGALLSVAFFQAEALTTFTEQSLYPDPIVFARQSHYQRLVVTQSRHTTQLFLNGNLQFSSADEYRYHEALVHPAFAALPAGAAPSRVLILGGGDGLALREILRYPGIEEITLVDLDAEVTRMGATLPALRRLNGGSLEDPRLQIVNDDAMVWIDEQALEPYDVIIIDFPDPNNFSLGKLYSRRFYRILQEAMDTETIVAVQSTSPLYARRSFWCIVRTMREAGLHTQPYHAFVPSFGEWGYVLARTVPLDSPERLAAIEGLRYLDDATLRSLFVFSADMQELEVETNRLDDQRLVRYYEREWAVWN